MAYSRQHKRNVRAMPSVRSLNSPQVVLNEQKIVLDSDVEVGSCPRKQRVALANNCQIANLLPLGAARIAIGRPMC